MKCKQLLALLLACVLLFAVVSCEPSESTTTTYQEPATTTEATEATTTVLATEVTTEPVELDIPIEEAANAIPVVGSMAEETKEIPLLVIIANFDADGDGENDWDPADPKKLSSDKSQPYYGEQWAGTKPEDHYNRYFGDGYSLTNYFPEMTMGAIRYVPAKFDTPPADAPYDNGVLEVTVNLPHPSALGQIINNSVAAGQCITAVVEAADPYINFNKFDTNGDGVIVPTELGVVILNPGLDAAYGSSDFGGRHPFRVHGTSQPLNGYVDDVKFSGSAGSKVTNVGEYGKNSSVQNVGTPIHELAHNLGAEDLYNRGGGTNTQWPMPYQYSLQCSGNHVGNGAMPSYLDPYQRIYLGWADYEVVEDGEEGIYTLYSTVSGKYKVLRINTPDPQEYYLVEVRTDEGFEKTLAKNSYGGGIMIWHIDEDINDEFFIDAYACTSAKINGKYHDPGIVPLFREGYDTEGRYITDQTPDDPYYYYDPYYPQAAVFDSGNFRSVTNFKQSLNSYPEDWEGPENYNLHIEVLSEPGQEMTIKVTSGRKDYAPLLNAEFTDKQSTALTIVGKVTPIGSAEVTACAIAISTKPDFSENLISVNCELSEDGSTFSHTFNGLSVDTKYYYKTYIHSTVGYVEATGDTKTYPAPKN